MIAYGSIDSAILNRFVACCSCRVLLYLSRFQSDGSSTIVLKAMGRAINKAVTIAEILKRKTPLHQWNALSSVEMIDIYEPVEEGLDLVHSRRYISCMTITLSVSLLTDPTSMDIHHIGYQPPLPAADLQKREFHLSSQQQQQPRYMVAATP